MANYYYHNFLADYLKKTAKIFCLSQLKEKQYLNSHANCDHAF